MADDESACSGTETASHTFSADSSLANQPEEPSGADTLSRTFSADSSFASQPEELQVEHPPADSDVTYESDGTKGSSDSDAPSNVSKSYARKGILKQSYEERLLDRDAIQSALATAMCCGRRCVKNFDFKGVLEWREAFASFNRPDQDLFLWGLAGDARSAWKFQGVDVCGKAMALLTRSGRRLKKLRAARNAGLLRPPLDLRTVARPRRGPKREDVLEYLRWMYESMAEALPTAGALDVDIPEHGPPDGEADVLSAYDTDLASLSGPASRSAQQPSGSQDDPQMVRYLPTGTWYEAWLMYKADRVERGHQPASFKCFWATWKHHFQQLQHTKVGTFAKCNQCVKYKVVLKKCIGSDQRSVWIQAYSSHLMSQYKDRLVYYHERNQSHLTAQGLVVGPLSTMTIIIDAMDQAKFCVPRHTPGSKSLKDAVRPRLHVVGVLVHGWFSAGYIFDPTMPKDSNTFIEILVQSIHAVFDMCRAKRMQPPRRLVVQADNAGDNKNQWVFDMIYCLTVRTFEACFLNYLRTGHSHEDIDACFGSWATHLCSEKTLETPTDFLTSLSKAFPKTRFQMLDYVRNWAAYLSDLMVKSEGIGGSVGAAHSFCCARRSEFDVVSFGQPSSAFPELPASDDVIMVCRKYMHSAMLAQPPLVALPVGRLKLLRGGRPTQMVARDAYSPAQASELAKTARKLLEFPFHLERAAAYLMELAAGSEKHWQPLPPTPTIHLTNPPHLEWSLSKSFVIPPANVIDPPSSQQARPVLVKPLARKQPARKRARKGKMSAGPPLLQPDADRWPSALPEVLPDGDIVGV